MESFSQHFRNDFPALRNDRILKVANNEVPDKIPVWILGQCDKYTKSFRFIVENLTNFNPGRRAEALCKLSLLPLKRFALDAAVIYIEMFAIPEALGMKSVKNEQGRILQTPLTFESIENLNVEDAISRLIYVGQAINMARFSLEGEVPLIGFTNGPMMLMVLMVENGYSETLKKMKTWLYEHVAETHQVLSLLTDLIVKFLVMQVQAGAQMLYVFEKNCESLSPELFKKFCLPYLEQISCEVKKKLLQVGSVPMILFAKGAHYCLEEQKALKYDVLAIDWCVPPKFARNVLGPKVVLQGNLDPVALHASFQDLTSFTEKMIEDFGTNNYIANLGHESLPDVDDTKVDVFIKAVHDYDL